MRIRSPFVSVLPIIAMALLPACGSSTADGDVTSRSTSESDSATPGGRSSEPRSDGSPSGEDGTPGRDRSSDPPEATDPISPPPIELPKPAPSKDPQPGEPGGPGDAPRKLGITWIEPSSQSERTLRVHYRLPTPCSPGLRQAEVTEERRTVTITLHREPEQKDDARSCVQVIEPVSTKVRLDRPLGDRTVLDASTGQPAQIGQ